MPPLTTLDLGLFYSVTTGTAGNSTAGSASTSLGKYLSTTAIRPSALDNVFDDVTADQHTSGQVDYRCLFVVNSHDTLAAHVRIALLGGAPPSGPGYVPPTYTAEQLAERWAIAADNSLSSPLNQSSNVQASAIASVTTAPVAIGPWSSAVQTPDTLISGIAGGADLGVIAAGHCKAFWIRRTAIAAEPHAASPDGVTLLISAVI